MIIVPRSADQLAHCLAEAAPRAKPPHYADWKFEQGRMAGPIAPSDVTISTARLNRVLEYEPRDLTISVGAGISYRELSARSGGAPANDPARPAFSEQRHHRRRRGGQHQRATPPAYGSARDMVIGMTFATLEGKLVQTGGMVVKNVAGLDMGKLMIGSFGTLAAIAR